MDASDYQGLKSEMVYKSTNWRFRGPQNLARGAQCIPVDRESLNARNADDLDWEDVKGLLIEEYMKRVEKSEKQESDGARLYVRRGKYFHRGRSRTRGGNNGGRGGRFQSSSGDTQPHRDERDKYKGIKCFKCNQDGHMVKNCALNNKQNGTRRESSNMADLEGISLISSTTNQSKEWLIDSAATKHMTNDRSILETYVEYQ